MTIYLDVLLVLNLFVNYFLLLSTSLLAHRNTRKLRLLLGASIGSISALLIFLPDFGFLITFLTKVIIGTILILITFGIETKKVFIKTLALFLAVNFVFAGIMFLIWISFSPKNMFLQNSIPYISISPLVLIIGSVVSYLCIRFFNIVISKRVEQKKLCQISIEINENIGNTTALIDTGNLLTDPFSGLPVVLWEIGALGRIIPQELMTFFDDISAGKEKFPDKWKSKLRLVPCETACGGSVLPAFLPDEFNVLEGDKKIKKKAIVAVCNKKLSDGEYHAIIGNI